MVTLASRHWLLDNLHLLAQFQFAREAAKALRAAAIEPLPWAEAIGRRGPTIVLPTDIASPFEICDAWTVPFSGTNVTLWHRLPSPGHGWSALPSEASPLWWRHSSGTLLPAWNVWAVVRDLLTFRDDREIVVRDQHGRLPAEETPRFKSGLLRVPIVNEANAVLLDAVLSLAVGAAPRLALPQGTVKPPGLALSHDCDQLRGNDAWTQGVRAYRVARAAVRLDFRGAWRSARGVLENAFWPLRYFMGNILDMIELERQFGFRSVSYILNGSGGRFGARSGSAIAREFVRGLPPEWPVGMHYNYDTIEEATRFKAQRDELFGFANYEMTAGRSHYLRFDPLTTPAFLVSQGIRFDESLGWADRLAYRGGIAGPFRMTNPAGDGLLDLVELPLVFTDTPLMAERAAGGFAAMFAHLQCIGGMVSILVHPGLFENPEQPEAYGVYRDILLAAHNAGSRSWTPDEILAEACTTI